ncbi:hypothetical protein [Bradyrhizobium sp. 2TAF24]|uniref:hypothetical protein n=1 Tax=Bradyrhizobium sp. 2TAF24 TaxID=3233011 RepID=UPI003F907682
MRWKLAVFLFFVTTCASAQSPDACDAILLQASRNTQANSESYEYLNAVFDQTCNAAGQTKSGGFSAGLDAVVKAIPIKFTLGASDASTATSNFCRNYRDTRYGSQVINNFRQTVVEKSLDTYVQCKAISLLGISLSHTIVNVGQLSVLGRAGIDRPIEMRGLRSSDNVSCETMVKQDDGGATAVSLSTSSVVASRDSLTIFCKRTPTQGTNGEKVYEEAAISIGVAGAKYDIFWPREEQLPENTASKIATSIQSIQNRIDILKSVRPLGDESASVIKFGPFGEVLAEKAYMRCPEGQIAIGLNLEFGGTCNNRCDHDGKPVRLAQLVCKAVEIVK